MANADSAPEPLDSLLPPDGRWSPAASAILRGTRRLLRSMGFATLPELPLASGRRADIVAIDGRAQVWIVEVKSCVEDYRSDHKWQDYRLHCDRLLFAVAPQFPAPLIPDEAGLIIADAYGAELMRGGIDHPLTAATRKAVTLRFAQAAASRLHLLADPAAWQDDASAA